MGSSNDMFLIPVDQSFSMNVGMEHKYPAPREP